MMTTDLIVAQLPAGSKKQAFEAIAEQAATVCNSDASSVFDALLERERIGSTGIGNGVAVPHIKLAGIESMCSILVQLETPVDYDALDDNPVDLIFMIIAPENSRTTSHLKVLANASRFLQTPKVRDEIRAARDQAAITQIFENWMKAQAA